MKLLTPQGTTHLSAPLVFPLAYQSGQLNLSCRFSGGQLTERAGGPSGIGNKETRIFPITQNRWALVQQRDVVYRVDCGLWSSNSMSRAAVPVSPHLPPKRFFCDARMYPGNLNNHLDIPTMDGCVNQDFLHFWKEKSLDAPCSPKAE